MARFVTVGSHAASLVLVSLVVVGSAPLTFAQARGGHGAAQPVVTGQGQLIRANSVVGHEPVHPVGANARFTSTLRFDPSPSKDKALVAFGALGFPFWPGNGVLLAPTIRLEPLPEDALSGGIQLDIEPRQAQVYVDGAYAGVVDAFSGYYRHLTLVAGPHSLVIVSPNYEPLTIEVMVAPGATVTRRDTLTRAYGR